MEKRIALDHGSGGKMSSSLINDVFMKHFDNEYLSQKNDSSILNIPEHLIAFTTDSYVINPVFFPGGNIGKLAVCGTINDLAVSGAKPLYISCGFIIEEGFPIESLEEIVSSMADEAKKAGVKIVTGDTKVVEKNASDGIFINTSGIGILDEHNKEISSASNLKPGDKIIINGPIAAHGMAVMTKRNSLDFESDIVSDCASLSNLVQECLKIKDSIKFMRDATRGGLGTVLVELAEKTGFGINVDELAIPIEENVRGLCEFLGFDPIYVANEGKLILAVAGEKADELLEKMKKHPLGSQSSIIAEITDKHPGKVTLETQAGGSRIIDMLTGTQLPRIC